MMRRAFLLLTLAACETAELAPPEIAAETKGGVPIACSDANFPASKDVVPYHALGTFEVGVTVSGERFQSTTRATVEILTSDIVLGATLSGMATLDDDGTGQLAGTISLVWPRGGVFEYAVSVAGSRFTNTACIEDPVVTLKQKSSTNNGAQTTVSACLSSHSSDGSVAVRLEGGTFKDGATEATLPLIAGACDPSADVPDNPSSHADLKVIAKQSTVDVFATIPNSARSGKTGTLEVQALEPLHLAITAPGPAAPLSIVELEVTATRGVAPAPVVLAPGIDLTFEATPAVVFVPATATTDDDGKATVTFQMPAAGPVYVRVHAGDAAGSLTIQ